MRRSQWGASLFDLLQAYGQVRARTQPVVHVVSRPAGDDAGSGDPAGRDAVGARLDWTRLESFLPEGVDARMARSALASSFVAALELARQGRVEAHQDGIFAPLYLRAVQGGVA